MIQGCSDVRMSFGQSNPTSRTHTQALRQSLTARPFLMFLPLGFRKIDLIPQTIVQQHEVMKLLGVIVKADFP